MVNSRVLEVEIGARLSLSDLGAIMKAPTKAHISQGNSLIQLTKHSLSAQLIYKRLVFGGIAYEPFRQNIIS